MIYYVSTSPKVGLKLISPSDEKNTTDLVLYSCSFHGCRTEAPAYFTINGVNCSYYGNTFDQHIWNKKVAVGQDNAGNPQGLSIYNFMNRAYGSVFDDRAVVYDCQVRELLFQRTKQRNYLRPGNSWCRNIEF